MDNNTQLQTYADLIKYKFNNMVNVKLPEFWWEDVMEQILEDENFEDIMIADFENENGVKFDYQDEKMVEDFTEYQGEWVDNYFDGIYVTYVVDGYNLDKLPKTYDVFYSDELESYIFLQTWFGMSAGMLTLPE